MNLFHHLKQQHLASVMTVKSCSAAEQTLETQLVTAAEVDPFYFTQYFLIMFFFFYSILKIIIYVFVVSLSEVWL